MCLGIPGRIVAIADEDAMLAVVDVSGVRRTVDVVCVAQECEPLEALIGVWVLVHVGFAMSRIDEAEAAKYPYKPACLPVARLEDGTMWNW